VKRAARFLCLQVLAASTITVSALAQGCAGWMHYSYSAYTNITWDGTNFDSSVLIDGTTTGNCPPVGCACNAEHWARSENMLGSVGGWVTGSQVPWNSYISFQNDQTFADPVPGEVYSFQAEGEVECTVAGLFAMFPFPDIDWGEAVTFTESTTVGGKSCPQANACLNTTLPECPVTLVIDQAGCFPFYETFVPYIGTVCFWANSSQRVSEPGVCTTKAQ
jgi:hypothetical protein